MLRIAPTQLSTTFADVGSLKERLAHQRHARSSQAKTSHLCEQRSVALTATQNDLRELQYISSPARNDHNRSSASNAFSYTIDAVRAQDLIGLVDHVQDHNQGSSDGSWPPSTGSQSPGYDYNVYRRRASNQSSEGYQSESNNIILPAADRHISAEPGSDDVSSEADLLTMENPLDHVRTESASREVYQMGSDAIAAAIDLARVDYDMPRPADLPSTSNISSRNTVERNGADNARQRQRLTWATRRSSPDQVEHGPIHVLEDEGHLVSAQVDGAQPLQGQEIPSRAWLRNLSSEALHQYLHPVQRSRGGMHSTHTDRHHSLDFDSLARVGRSHSGSLPFRPQPGAVSSSRETVETGQENVDSVTGARRDLRALWLRSQTAGILERTPPREGRFEQYLM